MEKEFTVAYIGVVAGDPEATDYEERCDRVGITRFGAPAKTILNIVKDTKLQNTGLDCSKFQIKPEKQVLDVHGGRTMEFYSSNTIADTLKNIDVLVISSSKTSYYETRAYLLVIAEQTSFPKDCPIVLQFNSLYDSNDPSTSMDAKRILSLMGMNENGEQVSTSGRFKRKQKGGHRQKIISIGHEKFGGVEADVGISQLHSVLFQTELTEDIIKPVKETMSAGKSFFNIGRSFGGWITNLFSSN